MPDGMTVTLVVQIFDLAAWAERFDKPADLVAAIEGYLIDTIAQSPAGAAGLLAVGQVGHTRWRFPE